MYFYMVICFLTFYSDSNINILYLFVFLVLIDILTLYKLHSVYQWKWHHIFCYSYRCATIQSYFHRDRKNDYGARRLIGRWFLRRFHYGYLACRSLAIKLYGKYIFHCEEGEGKITKPITGNHEHTKKPRTCRYIIYLR